MEKMKEELDVDEYSASQTTLEQIFNGFARDDEHIVEERVFGLQFLKDFGDFKSHFNHDESLMKSSSKSFLFLRTFVYLFIISFVF